MDDVPPRAPQTSLGMASFHLDTGYKPLFPFGFGLSYGTLPVREDHHVASRTSASARPSRSPPTC
jgi:beta-glucosidase